MPPLALGMTWSAVAGSCLVNSRPHQWHRVAVLVTLSAFLRHSGPYPRWVGLGRPGWSVLRFLLAASVALLGRALRLAVATVWQTGQRSVPVASMSNRMPCLPPLALQAGHPVH